MGGWYFENMLMYFPAKTQEIDAITANSWL